MKDLPPEKPHHLRAGERGEEVAARYLAHCGYTILQRNVSLRHDELDITAFDPRDDVLVFVEVKTRTRSDRDFLPECAFTWKKQQRMRRAARRYIANIGYDGGYRFDLVCVVAEQVVRHYEDIIE